MIFMRCAIVYMCMIMYYVCIQCIHVPAGSGDSMLVLSSSCGVADAVADAVADGADVEDACGVADAGVSSYDPDT